MLPATLLRNCRVFDLCIESRQDGRDAICRTRICQQTDGFSPTCVRLVLRSNGRICENPSGSQGRIEPLVQLEAQKSGQLIAPHGASVAADLFQCRKLNDADASTLNIGGRAK